MKHVLPQNRNVLVFALGIMMFVVLSCTKNEVEEMNYKGNLKVQVYTASEFFESTNDHEGFKLTLKGTNPEITLTSNASGTCTFENIPLGNYMLVASKEGYGQKISYNITLLENSTTDSTGIYMVHQSSTRIVSYDFTVSGEWVNISGTISHNYKLTELPYGIRPSVRIFLSDKPDVSSLNYLKTYRLYTAPDKDNFFQLSFSNKDFNLATGTKLYAIIYGSNWDEYYRFYDYASRKYYDPSLGIPSEIKTIVLP